MKRIFILLGILFSIQTVFSQNIVKAEYFLDADLGQGSGTAIANLTPGDIVNLSFDVPTNNLSSGFHFLNIRVADANGVWSRYETRVFYLSTNSTTTTTNITGAEYFIDRDTLPGSGTSVNIGGSGSIVNFPVTFPATLGSGFHSFAIRVKDQEGKWSIFEERSFYISPDPIDASPITAAEYFYDVDPGMGSASSLVVNPAGGIITQPFFIPVPNSLSQGDHVLAIRVKDQQGHWSFYTTDTITVSNGATISCPANTTVAAPTGQCTTVVNGIDPTITPTGSSYTYTLSGATTGGGTGTASGKIFNSGVTTVTYALTNSPSTSCSFTVTVNTNVVPSVSISASQTAICSGQQVNFTATPVNGGNSPVYEWLLNGNAVGTNSNAYQSSTLKNGDVVKVTMMSSLSCALPRNVVSTNSITMTVSPAVTPSVSIEPITTNVCQGTQVTFTANPINGGSAPVYQWKLNGNNVGLNAETYSSNSLHNGDIITVVLQTSLTCTTATTATSGPVTMTIRSLSTYYADLDGDGYGSSVSGVTQACSAPTGYVLTNNDCNDQSSSVHPGATEICGNGIDDDCDGLTDENCGSPDNDGDGYTVAQGDCNDNNSAIHPGATEVCNGIDDDCDGQIDEAAQPVTWYRDQDGDGYGNSAISQSSCTQPNGFVLNSTDCNDNNAAVHPGATEVCNGMDDDCDGQIDEGVKTTYYQDADGDGFGNPNVSQQACSAPQGYVLNNTDCNDNNTSINPNTVWYLDADNDNYYTGSGVIQCTSPGAGYKMSGLIGNGDCNDNNSAIHPGATEICNNLDDDCDGQIDEGAQPVSWYRDQDGDGYGNAAVSQSSCTQPNGFVLNNTDCNDNNATVHPGAIEVCNGVDDDCDGQIDEGVKTAFYKDADGDGYGNPTISQQACSALQGYVTNNTDCNDNNSAVHPGATEVCGNNIDDDCDGQVDEGCVNPDKDGDGYTVAQGDCNDNNAAVHPGATEVCGNGIDDDCDGQIDEGCNVTLPTLTLKTYPIKEGDVGQTVLNVEVTLTILAPLPVTVRYSTSDDDATAGADYVAASGTLLIPAGSRSGFVQIRIIGDMLRESNERFQLNFSNPVNAILNGDSYSRIMIIDDDKGKPTTASPNNGIMKEEALFKIPTTARRNQIWVIPQISNYENEILIVNVQGQVISKFVNYKNQSPLGNVSTGLYFYRIRIKESADQYKYYSGRLLVTE